MTKEEMGGEGVGVKNSSESFYLRQCFLFKSMSRETLVSQTGVTLIGRRVMYRGQRPRHLQSHCHEFKEKHCCGGSQCRERRSKG